ncbi:MAG: 2-succinyl-5-enolpyruvyl-6-hydroxy-3-cyclohexene-1-carboxylic-acid synthase [Chloroflexi bacterium]|nr:2-succinyl-5-enolpyruvyl-6-hydroxy-3-cyclohexene-1-carboxylic-acid synthase [Chloroflexota bacterium]
MAPPADHPAGAAERALGLFAAALADGLVAGGVRDVCLCPGSRSTPVAVAVQRHPALRTWIHLDERSCAYFALGLAQARQAPVALLCTSGTAALNFAPAVAEAATAGLPLVVLTADRPPELRGVGANQTVDQLRPYGGHAKAFAELPLPVAGDAAAGAARHWGRRAPVLATAAPAGPVQLNLPFREPLIPDLPAPAVLTPDREGPPPRVEPAPGDVGALASLVGERRRGLIVAGPGHAPDGVQAITGLAAALGYPILADPLSQLRRGPHDRSHVIAGYDAMLRAPAGPDLRPEVVLRVGRTPTSKALGAFLAGLTDAEQVVIAEPGRWNDPDLVATRSIDADPTAVCRRLLEALATLAGPDAAWLTAWRERERRACAAVDASLADGLTEPGAIRSLIDALPPGAAVVAGNSMPIRDLDTVLRPGPEPLHVYGNRGASGIDGVVSTALGIAAARPGSPLALVLGDLSAYHDMNGLLAVRRFGLSATIVVLNNDGGGIFSMLPQASRVPEFEPLFGTPHGLRFEHAAAQYGLGYARPATPQAYREALADSLARDGAQLIEVTTERAANAALHEAMWGRVRDALA